MARVLSAIVLLPIVVGAVWFFPGGGTLAIALVVAVASVMEYADIAEALGTRISRLLSAAAVTAACLAAASGGARPSDYFVEFDGIRFSTLVSFLAVPLDAVLAASMIAIAARGVVAGVPGPGALRDVAVALFPVAYIGVPLGLLVAVAADGMADGRKAVILLMAVIVVSDSAQYYTGRAFGRRALAPAISPKKTVEGAIGGLVFGTLAMVVGGRWVFGSPLWVLALVGATIAVLGMVGDLFESLLKRSAGVKDSGDLIPGHGGILDRIDSWLFAAPGYYIFVRWFAFRP
jgi:phosphatidate cytidylyltransferase